MQSKIKIKIKNCIFILNLLKVNADICSIWDHSLSFRKVWKAVLFSSEWHSVATCRHWLNAGLLWREVTNGRQGRPKIIPQYLCTDQKGVQGVIIAHKFCAIWQPNCVVREAAVYHLSNDVLLRRARRRLLSKWSKGMTLVQSRWIALTLLAEAQCEGAF